MQNKFRYGSLVVLIAFAINVMLPFFATYNMPAHHAEAEQLPSVFGEKLLICTGSGFKWVTLADLQSGKEKPNPHSDDKCPLCYVAHHGLKAIDSTSAPIVQREARIPALISGAYAPLLAPIHLASSLHVRAPPLSFLS